MFYGNGRVFNCFAAIKNMLKAAVSRMGKVGGGALEAKPLKKEKKTIENIPT